MVANQAQARRRCISKAGQCMVSQLRVFGYKAMRCLAKPAYVHTLKLLPSFQVFHYLQVCFNKRIPPMLYLVSKYQWLFLILTTL